MDFTWTCSEPEGKVRRHVRSVPRDIETIWALYDRVKGLPNFITSDTARFSVESMRWLFLPEVRLYLVDDVGAIVLKHIDAWNADVHITFWDKRLRGREMLCREVARRAFEEEHLETLWTAIPLSARVILAFAKRVGFKPHSHPESPVQYLVLKAP